jgi:hypothetical protein
MWQKGRIINNLKNIIMKKALLPISYFLPMLAFAQVAGGNLIGLIDLIGTIIGLLTPIVVGLALLYFFWGLAKYILASGDENAKAEGKNIMIWGIIALFVMVSVWGIVRLIGTTVGVNQGDTIIVPGVPGVGL